MRPHKLFGVNTGGMVRRAVNLTLIFSLIWFVLVAGDNAGWVIGGPMVILAVIVNLLLTGDKPWKINLRGGFIFIPYFLLQSTISGFDVLRRTFALKPKINPGMITYKTSLPEGSPRIILANSISLLPGTLSADLQDESIVVHTLDVDLPVWNNIQNLEIRIALLFSLVPARREA